MSLYKMKKALQNPALMYILLKLCNWPYLHYGSFISEDYRHVIYF